METTAVVFSGFLLAVAAPWLHRLARGATGWLLALLPLALAAWLVRQALLLPAEGLSSAWPWIPSLGVQLSFRLDGLSLLLALLITVMGAVVLIYAGGYLAGHGQLGRLYAFLLLFMASMLGLVLADNVLALFVFWELTSISSYLLIGFNHDKAEARGAALQALLVTGGGGLALLAGLLLMGQAGGTWEISKLAADDAIRSHVLYLPILALVLIGAATKSAQFPFHFWLPGAMEAPTPVSAYLHSATMVKAGVYLLARLHPVLGGTEIWLAALTAAGSVTMLLGAWLALTERDLKRILAYTTVSALGLLVLLLGLGAAAAAVTFLLAHALYKGALFLTAGALDHETGTRDIEQLSGLARAMPITALAAALAALSMAGLPPLLGFIAKEAVYEAALEQPGLAYLAAATVLASMMFVAAALGAGVRPFWGGRSETPQVPHEAPFSMWLGPLLLSLGGMALGIAPWIIDAPVLAHAAAAVQPASAAATLKLALWHGHWNMALSLSVLTVAGGLALFAGLKQVRLLAAWGAPAGAWGPARWYELSLAGLNRLARFQTRMLQSGYLRHYLLITLLTGTGLAGFTLLSRGPPPQFVEWSDIRFYEAGLAALIVMGLAGTLRFQSRLAAIACLGVVGFGVALLFVFYGAPDLAMTQFLIETLTVLLFVLVFYHLPAAGGLSRWPGRLRDGAVALAVGALMTCLVLAAMNVKTYAPPGAAGLPPVSDYYARESLPQAHGRNVVNVILVDFRALDTLGEIAVLSVAAVGVLALLKLRPPREETP